MIGPEVFDLLGSEPGEVVLVGAAIRQALAVGAVSGQIHRQGDVAPLGPEFGPLLEGRASTAVDQHYARPLALRLLGPGQVREDSRRFAAVRLALIVQGR